MGALAALAPRWHRAHTTQTMHLRQFHDAGRRRRVRTTLLALHMSQGLMGILSIPNRAERSAFVPGLLLGSGAD